MFLYYRFLFSLYLLAFSILTFANILPFLQPLTTFSLYEYISLHAPRLGVNWFQSEPVDRIRNWA